MNIDTKAFANPERECDLVMKGGITSGIVYPRVILKLAGEGKYRFRNIGGTSAGAIAAAVMAAAEFGRETGGFQRFDQLSKDLAKPGFLFNLFQPSPSLKPLMYTLLEVMGKISPEDGVENQQQSGSAKQQSQPQQQQSDQQQSDQQDQKNKNQKNPIQNALSLAFRLVGILQRRHPQVAKAGIRQGILIGLGVALLLTAIASIVFYGVAIYTETDLSIWAAIILFIVFGIPLGLGGYVLGVLGFGASDLIQKMLQELPQDNFFGVCTGRNASADPSTIDRTVLTDWLSSEIDRIAGVNHPLTFGDLNNKKTADEQKDVSITLKMVTSNLSQNQPYTLPFEPEYVFLFNATEFEQLFPCHVVKHLKHHGGKQRQINDAGQQWQVMLPPDSPYYFLPDAKHLPIVVAMRMSLSFPLLISAVPLYTIRQSAFAKQNHALNQTYTLDVSHDLQKNWFSDGGISSNFPIHFFDSWLPSRPTFGINLASVQQDALLEERTTGRRQLSNDNLAVTSTSRTTLPNTTLLDQPDVFLPSIGEAIAPEWVDLKNNLPTFLWQIFSTSQNYRDTMQSYLPGYRERIVQVRLSDSEGGLNLAMPQSTIDAVMQKGEDAGEILCNQFNFQCHKWVRLRVLLGLLDDKLRETYEKALKDDQFGATDLVDLAQSDSFAFKYPSEAGAEKAKAAIDRVTKSAELLWSQEPALNEDENAPRPQSVLRTTPEF